MIYGYCRISTKKQKIERQERNIISEYPNAVIVKEIYTGTKTTGRKGLLSILDKVKCGDTIVFDSVSRMSRNADEGIQLYMELYHKGITLVFLKEPHINTDTYRTATEQTLSPVGSDIANIYIKATNEVMMLLAEKQIRLAFEQSEKEVSDLHQRTKEGIETARQKGKQIGQKSGTWIISKKEKYAKDIICNNSKAFGGSLNDNECIKLAEVTKKTYYKYKKELREKELS